MTTKRLLSRLMRALPLVIAVLPLTVVTAAAAPDPPIPCPGGLCLPVPVQPSTPVIQLPIQPRPSPSATAEPSPSPLPPLPPGPAPVPTTPKDNLQAVSQWVFGGANWSVCQIPGLLQFSVAAQKCPPDQIAVRLPEPRDWFAPIYRRMIEIAGLLMLPMLLLAFLQALLRRELGMALRAAFGYVPLAVVLSAVAVSLTQTLLSVTDGLSDFMLNGYEGQVAATIGSLAGVLAAGAAGTVFSLGTGAAVVIAALVAIMAALAIVIELLARQALIYAGVLFLPLSFAGMVWPRLAAWPQRLVEVVVIAVFSKFLIVSVLVLGAAAFNATPAGGGPFDSQAPPGSTLLVGLLLVGLAALSPVALFWMLPTFEAAVLAQFHGAMRTPASGATQAAERSLYHLGLRRMWHARSGHGAGTVMSFGPGTQVFIRTPRYFPPPPPPPKKDRTDGRAA